ncbi:MAG: protein kinase [Deltaproteobacteria bacterium]|nr:protein kinase [Deltaproteobacteria bacterium]
MRPGDIIADKYRIASILGRGRGLLAEALHLELEERVVLRILPPSCCTGKSLKRFRRELETLKKLKTEHAARILDAGTHADGSFYLACEHLEGADLEEHIRERGALPLGEAVLLALQAMDAVAECHSHGIVLREIKPSDLFVTRRSGGAPLLKLVDFGTAKTIREATKADSTSGTVLAINPYCAPEIISGERQLDHRTDVWALGAMFYVMLGACPPFFEQGAKLLLAIANEAPTPLSRLRPDLKSDIDRVVARALAKSPLARFSDMHAFAHALRPHASAEGQVLIDRIGQTCRASPEPPTVPMVGAAARLLAKWLPAPKVPQPKRGQRSARPTARGLPPPTAPPRHGSAGSAPASRQRVDELDDLPTVRAFGAPRKARLAAGRGSAGSGPDSGQRADDLDDLPTVGMPGGASRVRSAAGSLPAKLRMRPEASDDLPTVIVGGDAASGARPEAPASGPRRDEATPKPAPVPSLARTLLGHRHEIAIWVIGAALVLLPLALVIRLVVGGGQPNPAAAHVPSAGSVGTARPAPLSTRRHAPHDDPEEDERPPDDRPGTAAPPARRPGPPVTGDFPTSRRPAAPANATGGRRGAPGPPSGPATGEPAPSDVPGETKGAGFGTVSVVVTGGTCGFTVDDSARGSGARLQIDLPAGPHRIGCSPGAGRATLSRTVTVRQGTTSFVAFRIE